LKKEDPKRQRVLTCVCKMHPWPRDPAHQQDRRSKSRRSTRKRKRVGCPSSFMFVHLAVALVLPTSLDPENIFQQYI
jgi:hypothetical protein